MSSSSSSSTFSFSSEVGEASEYYSLDDYFSGQDTLAPLFPLILPAEPESFELGEDPVVHSEEQTPVHSPSPVPVPEDPRATGDSHGAEEEDGVEEVHELSEDAQAPVDGQGVEEDGSQPSEDQDMLNASTPAEPRSSRYSLRSRTRVVSVHHLSDDKRTDCLTHLYKDASDSEGDHHGDELDDDDNDDDDDADVQPGPSSRHTSRPASRPAHPAKRRRVDEAGAWVEGQEVPNAKGKGKAKAQGTTRKSKMPRKKQGASASEVTTNPSSDPAREYVAIMNANLFVYPAGRPVEITIPCNKAGCTDNHRVSYRDVPEAIRVYSRHCETKKNNETQSCIIHGCTVQHKYSSLIRHFFGEGHLNMKIKCSSSRCEYATNPRKRFGRPDTFKRHLMTVCYSSAACALLRDRAISTNLIVVPGSQEQVHAVTGTSMDCLEPERLRPEVRRCQ